MFYNPIIKLTIGMLEFHCIPIIRVLTNIQEILMCTPISQNSYKFITT
jgi:hypothetical protein